jgi:hypothetical protein
MELNGQQAVLYQAVQMEGDRAARDFGALGNVVTAHGTGGRHHEFKKLTALFIAE